MSLIAWYPLNGDTKDYSGNNYHLTNNANLPVSEYGKIGKTYDFNLKKPMIYNGWILPKDSTWNDFTITAWIHPTETPVAHGYNIVSFSQNSVIRFRLTTENTIWVLWGGDNSGKIHSSITGSLKVPLNKWSHVTIRLKDGKITIYINGIKDTESSYGQPIVMLKNTLLIGSYSESSEAEAWRGRLNDIRIYNEALTTKQIKEISQAKIYHYSLNENIQPIKNLCKQYPIRQNITNNSTYTGTTFGKDEIGEYFIKQSTSHTWDGVGIKNIPIKTGVYYTVSFEIWCEKSFDLKYDYNISCDNISGNDAPRAEALNLLGTSYDTPKRWKKFAMRSKAKDDAVNPRLYDAIAGYSSNNANMVGTKVYFRNVMVEEKDREASYVEDSKSVILKNIDGYKDLSITSTQTYRFPKYEGDSLKFLPYSYVTTDFKLSTYNLGNSSSQLTTASWIKPTAVPATNSYGLIYGRADYQGFGLYFSYQDSSNIRVCTYHRLSNGMNTTASKLIKINEWSHVACVLDNTTSIIKMYINGEKVAEGPASTGDFTSNSNTFLLGGVHYPSGNGPWANFEGYIKDFRMYTTVLSDSDIKQLCKPETNIDKANVIRCSEINERNKIITESIEIVSAGYIANQNTYKVSIGDRYTTTIRETGWGVTEIDKDNNISYKTFATHSTPNNFNNLKTHVSNIPSTSTILLSTYDQPAASPTASNNTNCMNWINYLRSIGSTKLSGDFAYRSSYAAVIQGGRILEEVIDNSGMDSKIILNTNIELEISQNGFNKDASISFKEFNEIPEIKSGIHNLKLGDQILPVLVDMDNDGGRWARVFYHNCKSGTVLFSSNNSFAEAKETNTNAPTTSDKYSILSKLESFRPNTNSSFEFKLKYPTDTNGSNIWKQTSNPTYQKVIGYKPIKIDWTHNYWGGLEYNGNTSTLINGSVNHGNWYYAIGAANKHGDGIPSCTNVNNNGTTANDIELWVRINNYDLFADSFIDNVSISKDGVLTASEFREI